MRLAPLSATLLGGALLFTSGALAGAASRDTVPVRKQLASARTLERALRALAPGASSEISRQLLSCRGIQPSGTEKQQRLSTLIGLERVRQLQHNGLADYESFVAASRALELRDRRLRTAQGALAAELDSTRRLARVPIQACEDLKAFARGGYTAAALESWATGIDRKARISAIEGARTDRLVLASRPALRAAGLSAADTTALLHAETGEVFVYVFAR